MLLTLLILAVYRTHVIHKPSIWDGVRELCSCGRLGLSKACKDYESAVEGWECFLKEVRKDKKDGANLSGWLWMIKVKRIRGSELWDLFS